MKHITALRRILLAGDRRTIEARASRVGTTPGYLIKIAGGWGSPSAEMADALIATNKGLTLRHLVAARSERRDIGTHVRRKLDSAKGRR